MALTEPADLRPEQRAGLAALYRAAFPDEDLTGLVAALAATDALSIAIRDDAEPPDRLVAHIAFTPCRVEPGGEPVALLGPLAVRPDWQRLGLGSGLIGAGAARLAKTGIRRILVLGDPGYYGKWGFEREDRIAPPYPPPPAWRAAWQSIGLREPPPPEPGVLSVPDPWRDPSLWAP